MVRKAFGDCYRFHVRADCSKFFDLLMHGPHARDGVWPVGDDSILGSCADHADALSNFGGRMSSEGPLSG
jgi:hypothetical protein